MASTTAAASPASVSPSSSSSALPHWLTRWPFGSAAKQPDNITVTEIRAVDDPVHANQRVEKSFTVFAPPQTPSTSDALATATADDACQYNAVLRSPGLTVVRVRPQLVDEAGPDVVARVRVSSDAEEHLERVRVELSDERALSLDYNAAKRGTTGHLVTEIDVPRESQINQFVAMCGGDVVVDAGMLSSGPMSSKSTTSLGERALASPSALPPGGLALMALYGSRIFLSAPERNLSYDSLFLAALGSSSVHVAAQHVGVRREFLAGVVGTGRVDVRAMHFGAPLAMFAAIGAGNIQLTATQAFHAGGITAFLRGDGLVRVTTPPDALVEACVYQDISVGRSGTVDLADVPSSQTNIALARPAVGIARVRAPTDKLAIECPGSASDSVTGVQHVGELPADVTHKNSSALLTQLGDGELETVRAEWDANDKDAWRDAAAVPTIESAFETPVALDGPHEGWVLPIMAPLVRNVLPF